MAADPILSFLGSFQGQLLRQRQLNLEAMAQQRQDARFKASLAEQQAGRLQTAGFQRQRIDLEKQRLEFAQRPDPLESFKTVNSLLNIARGNKALEESVFNQIRSDPNLLNALVRQGGASQMDLSGFVPTKEVLPTQQVAQRKIDLLNDPDLSEAARRRLEAGVPVATTAQGNIFQTEAFGGFFTPTRSQAAETLESAAVTKAQREQTVNLPAAITEGLQRLGVKGVKDALPAQIDTSGRNSIPQKNIKTTYLAWRQSFNYDNLSQTEKDKLDFEWDNTIIPTLKRNPPKGVASKRIFWDPKSAEILALRGQ